MKKNLTYEKFSNYFESLLNLSAPNKIAIAVSGGADSIALLHLISYWSKDKEIDLYVFTVNHNLRSESDLESLYVKEQSEKIEAQFIGLSWDPGSKKSSLQERAREGRYDLMTNKCHEFGIDTLLTAHHLDDMLETYLMRKGKKSGVFGLSSSHSFFYNNIRILRPLSSFLKSDILQYLQDNNILWCEDYSNQSDIYERNRIRKKISKLDFESKELLISEMELLNNRAKKLNDRLISIIAESVEINNYGFAKIDLDKIKNENVDIKIQIFNHVLAIISGKKTIARFRNISKILNKFFTSCNMINTLHGCLLKKKDGKLWVFREKSAINSSRCDLDLVNGWDNRFDIEIKENNEKFQISALSMKEYLEIKDKIDLKKLTKISDNNHKIILFTLPVIKNLEKIVAIPHISYYDMNYYSEIKITFKANFISRFTHFL